MLARVAENLYWMGRHIERADFCTRYNAVQYFTSLSAPMSGHKDFILRSILYVSGSTFVDTGELDENQVWQTVIFNPDNPNSIFSSISHCRENGRSIRNTISSELWEAINKLYLFSKQRSQQQFSSSDLFWYSEQMVSHIALIKSCMVNTLLHDDVWHFLNLGILLERTLQVLKIIRTKISDSAILSNSGVLENLKLFQWVVMLRSVGAFDAHQNMNPSNLMSNETIFKLILSNEMFPRSIHFATNKIHNHLTRISVQSEQVKKISSDFFNTIQQNNAFSEYENQDAVITHIEELESWISSVNNQIQDLFFLKR